MILDSFDMILIILIAVSLVAEVCRLLTHLDMWDFDGCHTNHTYGIMFIVYVCAIPAWAVFSILSIPLSLLGCSVRKSVK
jgi:hypothetical protein